MVDGEGLFGASIRQDKNPAAGREDGADRAHYVETPDLSENHWNKGVTKGLHELQTAD